MQHIITESDAEETALEIIKSRKIRVPIEVRA